MIVPPEVLQVLQSKDDADGWLQRALRSALRDDQHVSDVLVDARKLVTLLEMVNKENPA